VICCPPKWLLIGACALALSLEVAFAQQTRFVSGSVRTAEDTPVTRTEVRIVGASGNVTTDSGGFSFPLSPPLKVGYVVTFLVTGLVIIDPCMMARGRTYLPDPDAETIALKVVKPGDGRLLSPVSIGCIVQEKASRFEPKPTLSKSSPTALLIEGSPLFVRQLRREMSEWSSNPHEPPVRDTLIEAAYHEKPPLHPLAQTESKPNQDAGVGAAQPIVDDFLIKQAKALGLTAERLRSAVDEWAKSTQDVYQKGLAAFYQGRYAEARRHFSDSIKDSPSDALERYVSLGRAEYETGNYSAAESALRKVLAVHSDDPLVLTNLGLVLKAEAKFSEAESLHNRALAIDEKSLGPDHTDVAHILSNLAELYIDQGKYAKAEQLYFRALAIDEKSLGPDQPDSAKVRAYLAAFYFVQGKPNEAEASLKQALAIDEKALGPNHPEVAEMLFGLGSLYQALGRDREAEPLYKRAWDIAERAVGPDHPDLARVLVALATIDASKGKFATAEPLYKRALALVEKGLGPEHPDVADVLNQMAQLYIAQQKYAQAEPLYRRALAIDEKALRSDHPAVAAILATWAISYMRQGKSDEAEPLLRRALSIEEKAWGPNAPGVAEIADALATCLYELGRDPEAKAFQEQAAKIRAKEK